MDDDEDLNIISLSCLFGEEFLQEELEYPQNTEDDANVEGPCENESRDSESVPAIHEYENVKRKSIVNLQTAMRNKLFKMSSKEVALYLTDISLGLTNNTSFSLSGSHITFADI